ncbi:DUF1631 family protein [Marinobacter sp. SS21]|uniref:DUF1631 family protein n=1 Tax=Marinobacter sp. SS21 TaxID=2979460 RepID=UPI002330E40A|nr:DUF1631 family protein [Marinobacter sp. SS21]MDC0661857.1 DUF1631 family protein [Marinobacter sp. SS21]
MSQQVKAPPGADVSADIKQLINDIICGIRIPDLPYPVGPLDDDRHADWRPLLLSCWNEQRDESVVHLIKSVSLAWTVRQVNSAYLADRIMDVFLQTSGLHVALAGKVARLRFFLAWRLNDQGASGFEGGITNWLDSLGDWRGWSDSGGRSARALLDQLDAMVIAVSACFETGTLTPFSTYSAQWATDADLRLERVGMLRSRLLATEQGAARQRWADHTARALVGRALIERELPDAISEFVVTHWLKLLRQVALNTGMASDDWRHARKLLEWLVWVGDPSLSDGSSDRLYHVGEQIGDRLSEVWQRVFGQALAQSALNVVETVIVARLRGEPLELAPALGGHRNLQFDEGWLTLARPSEHELAAALQQWFVEGQGADEQRRFFLAFLDDTCEVLWTNGAGVKLGLLPWSEFVQARSAGRLRPIPPLNRFQDVLKDTVLSLAGVYHGQRRQREQAALQAKARAEELRRKVEAAEQQKREELTAKLQEQQRLKAEEEAKQQQLEEAERLRVQQERLQAAQVAIDGLKLGSWIAVPSRESGEPPTKMKLAVRINASRKLVFVDRLGLNRREFLQEVLVKELADGRVRILSGAVEFDDTLTRVVGRIRVGRH